MGAAKDPQTFLFPVTSSFFLNDEEFPVSPMHFGTSPEFPGETCPHPSLMPQSPQVAPPDKEEQRLPSAPSPISISHIYCCSDPFSELSKHAHLQINY